MGNFLPKCVTSNTMAKRRIKVAKSTLGYRIKLIRIDRRSTQIELALRNCRKNDFVEIFVFVNLLVS